MSATARGQHRVAEPRVAYGGEPILPPVLVVDCSVVAAQVFQEPERLLAEEAMSAALALCAPTLLPYEIASVAYKKTRRGEPELALLGIELFSAMDVGLHRVNLAEVCALATHYKLSSYDASYLWLAKHLDAPLFTFDRALQRAAEEYLNAP